MFDRVDGQQAVEGVIPKGVRQAVEIAENVGAAGRIPVDPDGSGLLVNPAADVQYSWSSRFARVGHSSRVSDVGPRWPLVTAGAGLRLPDNHTDLVHNGVMRTGSKTVRQSVSLPSNVAVQVRTLARTRRLSANRMLVELIENGIDAEKRKQQEFFDLAERFRAATDPEEVKRLGDRMGRMVFGV
jgi:hypothetical protein